MFVDVLLCLATASLIRLTKGYREPQKWVAMLILSYTYLAALGVDDLIPRLRNGIGKLMDKIAQKSQKVCNSNV